MTLLIRKKRPRSDDDDYDFCSGMRMPDNFIVDFDEHPARPLLFDCNGNPYKRQIGFNPPILAQNDDRLPWDFAERFAELVEVALNESFERVETES